MKGNKRTFKTPFKLIIVLLPSSDPGLYF